jgi:hypothetical protein
MRNTVKPVIRPLIAAIAVTIAAVGVLLLGPATDAEAATGNRPCVTNAEWKQIKVYGWTRGLATSRDKAARTFGTRGERVIKDGWDGYRWEQWEYRACPRFGGRNVKLTVNYENGHRGGGMRAWLKTRDRWW